ncbi:MAG: alpha/beta hydrolase [Gemmatimonadaceae bacterium]
METNETGVVLVHGAFSVPEHLSGLATRLESTGYRVTRVRLRGHAASGERRPHGARLTDYLQDVLDAVDQYRTPPVVVGHSMGGLLALRASQERRCAAALLLAPAPAAPLLPTVAVLPVYATILHRVLAGLVVDPPRAGLARHALGGFDEPTRREVLGLFVPESGAAFRDMMFGLMRVDPRRVSCPVAMAFGDQDAIVPRIQLLSTARRYAATVFRYPTLGHFMVGERAWEPAEDDVVHWLTQVAPPVDQQSESGAR